VSLPRKGRGWTTEVYAIETVSLTKQYGKAPALKGLDFTINENEIMVLLGPNGSGKTTLLLILATVLKPTSGHAKVMGFDVTEQPTKVRQILGIAFQDARGFWRHKPTDILRFHANVCNVPKTNREASITQILKELELWEARNKLFMHLSGGQAKRVEVAKIFVQRPKFAILDEPTSQVDLRGKRQIWEQILKLREEGSTLLVATNDVREAEYLADRVTVLDRGEKIACETVRQLKDTITGGDIVELEIDSNQNENLMKKLKEIEGTVEIANLEGNQFKAHVSKAESWVPKMTNACYKSGAHVVSVRITEPSLDDVFLHLTGRALREG
jgi:ABC-2 type transport system ATP-binding protein